MRSLLLPLPIALLAGFSTAQSTNLAFAPHVDLELPASLPKATALGDFDGDGKVDVAVSLAGQEEIGRIAVLLGSVYPQLDAIEFVSGGQTWGIAAADFDEDGFDDLAATLGSSSSNQVRIFRSSGNGSFTLLNTVLAGSFPISVEPADFDEDGHVDLAVASNVSGGLRVFLGNGDGTFGAALSLGGTNCTDVAVGDYNGDGHRDLVMTQYSGTRLWHGLGNGSFVSDGSVASSALTQGVAMGDLNGDGRDDIATVELYTDLMRVVLSKPGGGFFSSVSYDLGGFPNDVRIADVNGDGIGDVIAVAQDNDAVSVWLGLGGGALGGKTNIAAGPQPTCLAVVDLDADGALDVMAPCRNLAETPPAPILVNQTSAAQWAWTGAALSGANGVAAWSGAGDLSAGSPVSATLTSGTAFAPALLVVGQSAANLPLLGGLLVPNPDQLVAGIALDASGGLDFQWPWPASLPSGSELYTQVWFFDPGAVELFAASNGLVARVP
ncbi:FG-GAP repeat domain-containing protein [Engelhardtia mirabilis]|uniref:FG-GAP repeat protein n=1 Tax=Engelhardtia mirabilis TaxID=2528011 RepID=A0A518BQC2_9BACT|nr:FG-GAP repeat protein [Planctomycetes bacterium Pla133]QDV03503.1 FG-GAP repeat protein [Planctomycetes bacterium Pla86]